MEGLEEYQDLNDDFWNYDSSEIYDNIDEGEVDYNSDIYLRNSGKKLKERTDNYKTPFLTIDEINSVRENLFNSFQSIDFKIYKPLCTTHFFRFGKYKGALIEEVFENKIQYIQWLIGKTGAVFYLKNHYTFSIKCGLDVPTLLINEMKLEYYEGLEKKRKIFVDKKVIKVTDDYYDLYL